MAATSPLRARQRRARTRLSRVSAAGLLMAAGALAGCGGLATSASSTRPLAFASPALVAGQPIPPVFTCSGKDVSLPLQWANVPPHTAELALFQLGLSKVHSVGGGAVQGEATVRWIVTGLKPTLNGLLEGKLPAGVTTRGRYSICSAKGQTSEYLFRLYALPSRLAAPRPGEEEKFLKQVDRKNLGVGYFVTRYQHR